MNELSKEQREQIEQRALRKYAILRSDSDDTISVPKSYVEITGDFAAAFVLDELIFWTLPKRNGKTSLRSYHDGKLWLAVSRSEWWDRKRLSENQADYALEKLVKLGLIEKKVFKYEGTPRTHIRLIPSKFFSMFSEVIAKSIPEEDENETLEIADLYAMMGLDDTLFRKIPNPISENSENLMDSENSEIINSPQSSNTINEKISKPEKQNRRPEKQMDLVDGMLEFMQGAPVKKAQRLLVLEGLYHTEMGINPVGKDWQAYLRFVDDEQQDKKRDPKKFIAWMKAQPGYSPLFWPPRRMQQFYEQAYMQSNSRADLFETAAPPPAEWIAVRDD